MSHHVYMKGVERLFRGGGGGGGGGGAGGLGVKVKGNRRALTAKTRRLHTIFVFL